MTVLPTITNAATAATNEAVNLSVLNAYLPTTGVLAANNTWTGENDFRNKVIVPTPTTDSMFGNKKYVDDEITAFNALGVSYQEVLSQNGSVAITCDPNTFTSMTVCLVGAGGNGAVAGAVPTGDNAKSFGGAGGYVAFQIPAYSGVATLEIGTIQASWTYFVLNGTTLAGASAGEDGDSGSSGESGGGDVLNGLLNGQRLFGKDEPYQNPVSDDTIQYSYNIGVLNGYGQGGSFRWDTGTRVNPTGFYALFMKFRKT